jgi:hypothetical protein
MDAPFVTHPWVSENLRGARAPPHADLLTMLQNYTQPNKDGYETQHFRAALQAQQYEHWCFGLLHSPPRPGDRLHRATESLRTCRQLTAFTRPRRIVRWRARRQTLHGELVRQSRRQPSFHGAGRENSSTKRRACALTDPWSRSSRRASGDEFRCWRLSGIHDRRRSKPTGYEEQTPAKAQASECSGKSEARTIAACQYGGVRVRVAGKLGKDAQTLPETGESKKLVVI